LRLTKRVILKRLKKIADKSKMEWVGSIFGVLSRTKSGILLILSLYIASLSLRLPDATAKVLGEVAVIVVLLQIGFWLVAFVNLWQGRYRKKHAATNPAAVTSMQAFGYVAKGFIWLAMALLAMDNLGINITALVAGLGIGGIAVALAVQHILGDVLASMTIVMDKPFVVGDFLTLGEFQGTVEHIGLKTTRLRSLSGEQLVMSNGDLLGSRIRNFGRMEERRVVFTLGVTYQTPREKLQTIPATIRSIIEAQSPTRFDRSHFMRYGASSLDFETVYFVLSADYNQYMDIQQTINLQIHEAFEREGIAFAYPTQTVFVEKAA
jgi:small-conductance mechanosensitive channel